MGPWLTTLQKELAARRAAIAVGILCGTFTFLGILVRYSAFQSIDLSFSRELQEANGSILDRAMHLLTLLGDTRVVLLLTAVSVPVLTFKRMPGASGAILMSLLGLPIDYGLKLFWARARPDDRLVRVLTSRDGFSFPSGHAVLSTAFYGVLAVLIWVHLEDHPLRRPLTFALACIPPIVDVSRVYLGAHWLSDVIGGSAVGLALLIPIAKWYAGHAKRDVVQERPLHSR